MLWLPLALVTATCFGLYNTFIKLGSARIDQVLGAVVLQVVSALVGGAFALVLYLGGRAMPVTRAGLGYAALAGLAVAVAEILMFVVLARGAPSSLATPIIMGGSVVIAALVGMVFLRESLGVAQIAGIILVTGGIVLLSSGRS
jgi:transporter family protein